VGGHPRGSVDLDRRAALCDAVGVGSGDDVTGRSTAFQPPSCPDPEERPVTRTPDEPRDAAIRVLMMPRDTNHHGTIFGGVILSYIDQAGAVAAIRLGCTRLVTVAMDRIVFNEPVYVGDLVSFYAELISRGRTSLRVRVTVEAERRDDGQRVQVTEAEVTYVQIDPQGRPAPLPAAP
jgi:acyl-CoA thioesterase YciA